MTTTLTPEQVRDYLDSLAALTAEHGLMIDDDLGGHMALGTLPASLGGYIARRRDEGGCWEVGIAEAGLPADRWPVSSIDVTRLSAHQRLELDAALRRVREIVRGGGG